MAYISSFENHVKEGAKPTKQSNQSMQPRSKAQNYPKGSNHGYARRVPKGRGDSKQSLRRPKQGQRHT